jgi:hypothetical protein
MISASGYTSYLPPYSVPEAVLAQMIMAKDETPPAPKKRKSTIKKEFDPGSKGKPSGTLFAPDEMDIYVNKVTLEAYIFHGKEVDYESLDRLEYDSSTHMVDVVKKDGTRLDLGVKIQWLVRPYFTKAEEINIVRTKDGNSIDGKIIPLIHKDKKGKK